MMKYLLIFCCMALAFVDCGEKESQTPGAATTAPVVAPLDLSNFELRDISGTDLQKAIWLDSLGHVKEEGTIRNGKRHGTWVVYHKDKELPFTVSNYSDDQLNGVHLEYAPSGHLVLTAGYINNILDGRFARYKNGRLTESGFYKNGQFDGIYRRFYETRDALQQEIAYKDGKMHGHAKYYNEEGQLVMEYEYKLGEKLSGGIVTPGGAAEK